MLPSDTIIVRPVTEQSSVTDYDYSHKVAVKDLLLRCYHSQITHLEREFIRSNLGVWSKEELRKRYAELGNIIAYRSLPEPKRVQKLTSITLQKTA